MLVTWNDLGRPKTPGTYWCDRHGVRVEVSQYDVDLWKEFPEARCKLLLYRALDEPDTYTLGKVGI